MYYIIYQITNKLNGKIYIGKHKTEDKNDDYMGSGKYLLASQKYHGIENFEKKILFECETEEEMNKKEREIVDENFIARDDTYNIAIGGEGGNRISWDSLSKYERHLRGLNAIKNIDSSYKHTKEFKNAVSNGLKKAYMEDKSKCGMLGKKHREESKKKMSDKKKDPKINKMIGGKWIYNATTFEQRVISKDEKIPDGWIIGRKPKEEINHNGWNWVNRNGETKYISSNELEKYISDGWSRGRLNSHKQKKM